VSTACRKTPLYEHLTTTQARFTEFAGWQMPLQFSGLRQEHQAVRTAVGMFDISHMAKFQVQGPEVCVALQRLVPTDLSSLAPGQAQYTVLLNAEGGILDDLIIYLQSAEQALIIANAATHASDRAWLVEHLSGLDFTDLTFDRALLAVQGPQATATLEALFQTELGAIPAFGHREIIWQGEFLFLARTGYTGEDGFEIMLSPTLALQLWKQLQDRDVTPCGLGARDTLRLEAAMALYGQDIDTTTTP
jgi:aminomethyltransferase